MNRKVHGQIAWSVCFWSADFGWMVIRLLMSILGEEEACARGVFYNEGVCNHTCWFCVSVHYIWAKIKECVRTLREREKEDQGCGWIQVLLRIELCAGPLVVSGWLWSLIPFYLVTKLWLLCIIIHIVIIIS